MWFQFEGLTLNVSKIAHKLLFIDDSSKTNYFSDVDFAVFVAKNNINYN